MPPRCLSGLFLQTAILACCTCFASTPQLVSNINTQPIGVGSDPAYLGTLAGWTYFVANDSIHGKELWKTDGTAANTTLVRDINAGVGGSAPAHFFAVGNVAYFSALSDASGNELWVTDGTTNGTRQVADIAAGPQSSNPVVVGTLAGKAFVITYGGAAYQLWITDGTQAGTIQLGPSGRDGTSWPRGFTLASNGKAYYIGFNGVYGAEPWVSDGTPGGTHRLPDGAPNAPIQNPHGFVQVGNYVYFVGMIDNAVGGELWRIRLSDDGIEKVTTNLNVIGAEFADGESLTVLGNVMIFVGESGGFKQVWRSDGTAAGTFALSPYNSTLYNSQINPRFSVLGGHVVYMTNADNQGAVFFSTDGTVTGTVRLFDNAMAGYPQRVGIAGGFGYFTGDSGLIRTDGTRAGTTTVQPPADFQPYFPPASLDESGMAGDVNSAFFFSSGLDVSMGIGGYAVMRYEPASNSLTTVRQYKSPLPHVFAMSQGKLFFSPPSDTAGYEPWISDGTSAGTKLIANVAIESMELGSIPNWMTVLNGQIYFAADDGLAGSELWQTNGTDGGTRLAVDVLPGALGSAPERLFSLGNALLFFAGDGGVTAGGALWRYEPATQVLQKIPGPGLYRPVPFSVAEVQGSAYFAAMDPAAGVELWRTDGTAAGTRRAADVISGFGSSNPLFITALGNKVFFFVRTFGTDSGYGLWSSDGTEDGTSRVVLHPTLVTPTFMVSAAGALYYVAADSNGVRSLWRSDGTAAGTVMVASFPEFASYLGLLNGRLLFAVQGNELRTFDPATATFTSIVVGLSLLPGPVSADGKRAFFAAHDSTHGFGPWVTDGTTAGTTPLADVAVGTSIRPTWIGDFRGTEVFLTDEFQNAHQAVRTRRYWRSDGTASGTVAIAPLGADQTLGTPTPLAVTLGDRFLFTVSDPTHGTELYGFENEPPTTVADSATTNFGEALAINVLANDSDPDGALDPSQVAIVTAPQHGTATVGTDGKISYAPAAGYSGADAFTYSVRDNQGRASASTTVSVTVAAGNNNGGGGSGSPGSSGSGGGGGGALDWSVLLILTLILGMARERRNAALIRAATSSRRPLPRDNH